MSSFSFIVGFWRPQKKQSDETFISSILDVAKSQTTTTDYSELSAQRSRGLSSHGFFVPLCVWEDLIWSPVCDVSSLSAELQETSHITNPETPTTGSCAFIQRAEDGRSVERGSSNDTNHNNIQTANPEAGNQPRESVLDVQTWTTRCSFNKWALW